LTSVSQAVAEVLMGDPVLRQCIARRVVNYRRLARVLQPAVSRVLGREVPVDTIKVALLRYSRTVGEEGGVRREVLEVLARSSVELRTDITIVIVRSAALSYLARLLPRLLSGARFVAIMQSALAATLVLDHATAEELLKEVGEGDIIEVQRGQAAIVIVSPREIMRVPGVIAYVASVLSQHGVNIVHIESCYTDTVIVVSKEDLERAFTLIVRHIEGAREMLST